MFKDVTAHRLRPVAKTAGAANSMRLGIPPDALPPYSRMTKANCTIIAMCFCTLHSLDKRAIIIVLDAMHLADLVGTSACIMEQNPWPGIVPTWVLCYCSGYHAMPL